MKPIEFDIDKHLWIVRLLSDLMTDDEKAAALREQRRSFVYGNTKLHNESVTREMVDEIDERMEKNKKGP